MNIHIFATYTKDWTALVDLVHPLWTEYAQRHGYHLAVVETERIYPEHYSFTKTYAAAEYLRLHRPELLWVIDLDMIPTDMTILAQSFLDPFGSLYSVHLTRDINGLNSGSYFITPFVGAFMWLETIVGLRSVCSSEQHAMWLIQEGFNNVVGVLHHPSINSIPYHLYEYGLRKEEDGQWGEGHLTCHLPGMSMAKRIEILKAFIPLIKR